jgi:hypothetical protein
MIKKALIAISVASMFALVGAEALIAAEDVSLNIGGRVRGFIMMTDSTNDGTTSVSKPMHMKADSRFGASGSKKDGAYTGSFHVERAFNNGAAAGEGNRNAFVKLATAGWSVALGKQAQPYICHTGKVDLDTIGGNDCPMWSGRNESLGFQLNNVGPATVKLNYQANNVAGTDEHQTRVIPAVSMEVAGLNLDLVIVSGSTKGDKGWGMADNATATKSTEAQTALAVSGSAGAISYAVGMNNSSTKIGDADATAGSIITLGLKYSLGATGDIGFLYDSNNTATGDAKTTASGMRFSYGTTIAGVRIGAGIRNASSKAAADADTATSSKMSLGFQYGF